MNLELEVDSKGRSEFQGTSRRDGVSTIKDRRRSREDPSLTGRNNIGAWLLSIVRVFIYVL